MSKIDFSVFANKLFMYIEADGSVGWQSRTWPLPSCLYIPVRLVHALNSSFRVPIYYLMSSM